jgi:hypothetical protein
MQHGNCIKPGIHNRGSAHASAGHRCQSHSLFNAVRRAAPASAASPSARTAVVVPSLRAYVEFWSFFSGLPKGPCIRIEAQGSIMPISPAIREISGR